VGEVVGLMESTVLSVRTGRERAIVDLTGEVAAFCSGRGDGLVSVFVPHATAGLALVETGAGSEADLLTALDGLLPRDGRWRHRHGSPGHGADHVLPAFVSPSLTVPVLDGRMTLGTWQSVVLVDTNVDNADRSIRLSFLPA
jgi:secondary thiamine-phosphate synthase enzyme